LTDAGCNAGFNLRYSDTGAQHHSQSDANCDLRFCISHRTSDWTSASCWS